MVLLGVNVDHVATVRQARRTNEPDPVAAAAMAELAGADVITVHLREDRRHIQDRDLLLLRKTVTTKLNLEMALSDEIIGIAHREKPEQVTLVPEKRREITTEGGLDVAAQVDRVRRATEDFHASGIIVSLFIDPVEAQVKAARQAGADAVELHTGPYANAGSDAEREQCVSALLGATELARSLGLVVNAGHGLTYHNVRSVVQVLSPWELHIGHSIISRAIYVGITQAVREMKEAIYRAEMLRQCR